MVLEVLKVAIVAFALLDCPRLEEMGLAIIPVVLYFSILGEVVLVVDWPSWHLPRELNI